MRSILTFILVGALLSPALAENKRRPGRVQFSNGDVLEGQISMTPGADLRLHVEGRQIRALDFERVREIRITPLEEKMVQKWRFLAAGQTKKEFSGPPYLIRSLQTTAFLAGADQVTGHLYTTVLYVEPEDGKPRKVVLQAKQTGKPGETADALAYPSLIRFTDAAAGTEETIRLRLNLLQLGDPSEVAALVWGSLLTLEGTKAGPPGEYAMPSPLGRDLFLALKTGNRIAVGWPKTSNPKFTAIVQTHLAFSEDFFDDRKLLGVYYDEPNSDVYSILMMSRKSQTTLDAAKSQPWRLVVLRWKYDAETQRVLLAGRGHLFRGILAKGDAPPDVTLSNTLWRPRKQGPVWVAGPEGR